jgi:hypothetical protein
VIEIPSGREDRVAAAPGAPAPEKLREGRVTTGTGGNNRPSLRDGLRLIRALPGEPAFCHRRRRDA